MDEYRSSVDNLQQWIDETRKIAQSPPKAAEASAKLSLQQKQLQEVPILITYVACSTCTFTLYIGVFGKSYSINCDILYLYSNWVLT